MLLKDLFYTAQDYSIRRPYSAFLQAGGETNKDWHDLRSSRTNEKYTCQAAKLT